MPPPSSTSNECSCLLLGVHFRTPPFGDLIVHSTFARQLLSTMAGQGDAESIPDRNDFTPAESIDSEFCNENDPLGIAEPTTSLLAPWPGSTFTIRSVSSGRVLTLLNGQIVLTQPSSQGSIY